MRTKSWMILLAILALGLFLRVFKINSLPMYGDELTIVYDTYSISKTGMDQTGERFPLTFKMGAGRPAGYIYGSIPFVAAFGMTPLGVRMLSILSGLGIIMLVYLLAKEIFSQRAALIASLLTAISPWDLALSRAGFESHFGLFLALGGVVAFVYSKTKPWLLVLTALSWGLAIHTYPTFKLTLPLILVALIWYRGIARKFVFVAILIITFFGILSVKETLKGVSEQRFLAINVFSQVELRERIIQKVNYERTISGLPEFANKIFHNKAVEYSKVLAEGYFKNLSDNFLVLNGDGNPRHNPAEMGVIYLVELVSIFLGLFVLWVKKRKEFWFLVAWLMIGPLPTALLLEAHGLRSSFMLPSLILLSAYGIAALKHNYLKLFLAFGILIELVFMLERIYFVAPTRHASFWSTEAKQASLAAIENKGRLKTVVLSTKIDNIEYAYPVYAKIDPNLVIAQYGKYPKRYDNVVISDK